MHRIFSYNVKIKYFKHVLMDFGPWHLQGLNCMQPLKFNFIILTSLLLRKYRMCRKQNNHIYTNPQHYKSIPDINCNITKCQANI